MMKSNIQGHKSIKKMCIGVLASTLTLTALEGATMTYASDLGINDLDTKIVTKDEVKSEVEEKIIPKIITQADVDKAKAELDKAKQDVAKQKEVVTATETKIAETEKLLRNTNKKIEDVKLKLSVLSAELDIAKKELVRLEGIAVIKARGYNNWKNLRDEYNAKIAEEQHLKSLKDKADAIRKAGGEPKEVTDATGKVINIVDAKETKKEMVGNEGIKHDKTSQESVKITNSTGKSKERLPNTGMKDSMLGLLGFTLLASLGLGYMRKYLRK